jgi:hypothetical protein
MMNMLRSAVLTCILAFPGTLHAANLAAPVDQVILKISGEIAVGNVGDEAHFDREMLRGIGMSEIETTTDWTDGVHRFAGPRLEDVLALVEAGGVRLMATAINDYTVEIPRDFAETYGAILALDMDGEPMSVRDKGPIWIVFPKDSFEELEAPEHNAYWIWQLNRIEVR